MLPEQVAAFISEFAESSSLVDTFAEIQDGVWGFECGVVDVALSLNARKDMLILESVVDVAADTDRSQLYRALLSATVSQSIPRIRMSLDAPGGDVVQELDVPLADLDNAGLHDAVHHFFVQATTAAERCGQPSAAVATSSEPEFGAIRV